MFRRLCLNDVYNVYEGGANVTFFGIPEKVHILGFFGIWCLGMVNVPFFGIYFSKDFQLSEIINIIFWLLRTEYFGILSSEALDMTAFFKLSTRYIGILIEIDLECSKAFFPWDLGFFEKLGLSYIKMTVTKFLDVCLIRIDIECSKSISKQNHRY